MLLKEPLRECVPEFENVMRKLIALNDPGMIVRDLLRTSPSAIGPQSTTRSGTDFEPRATILEQVTQAKQQAERAAIFAALESTQWNRKKAALLLKIDYKALRLQSSSL
jgi:DNA-binding NtrC family response regulator